MCSQPVHETLYGRSAFQNVQTKKSVSEECVLAENKVVRIIFLRKEIKKSGTVQLENQYCYSGNLNREIFQLDVFQRLFFFPPLESVSL